ncbi:uncharacterized protein LOC125209469 [Salvia hispanica]|uniref:uncharacterized protein LOC125209469 n=1 Tax=Salvia hispanica TaxID=49212 RepID=UPI002009AEB6|nr:uncharacterized protein LOC125209469 [Salvia hispanica]
MLQAHYQLVKGLTSFFFQNDITNIIYATIVLHNMMVGDEGQGVSNVPVEATTGSSHDVSSESYHQGIPHSYDGLLRRFVDVRQKAAHVQLQYDMIEEIWACRHWHE